MDTGSPLDGIPDWQMAEFRKLLVYEFMRKIKGWNHIEVPLYLYCPKQKNMKKIIKR